MSSRNTPHSSVASWASSGSSTWFFSSRHDAWLCIVWRKGRHPAVVRRLLHAECPVVIAKDGDGEARRLGSRAIEAHQLKRGAPCHKRAASSKRRLSVSRIVAV